MRLSENQKFHLKKMITELMERPYCADVERLNAQLGFPGKSANFAKVPPMPFSGNPLELQRGNCIALIGINPAFQPKRSKAEYQQLKACAQSFHEGDPTAVNRFLKFRGTYFLPESQIYYGNYFTRIGNYLASVWFKDIPARTVFQKYVLKSDCLPWLSTNASTIDFRKLVNFSDTAFEKHRKLLIELIVALQPRWIEINGVGAREFIQTFFDTNLHSQDVDSTRYYHGHAKLAATILVPIFMHRFANRLSKEQFRAAALDFSSRYSLHHSLI